MAGSVRCAAIRATQRGLRSAYFYPATVLYLVIVFTLILAMLWRGWR